jgi:hypothetical protein
MTSFEFIAALVGHLAWPFLALIVFLSFRRQILARLPLLDRLAYKGLEMEFRKELGEAERVVRETDGLGRAAEGDEAASELDRLADVSPRAALLEAWLGFEVTAPSTLQGLEPDLRVPHSFPKLLEALHRTELLTAEEVGVLRDLRELRNRAVHEADAQITSEQAKRYGAVLRNIAEIVASRGVQMQDGR